jgi:hypothetical protein
MQRSSLEASIWCQGDAASLEGGIAFPHERFNRLTQACLIARRSLRLDLAHGGPQLV